MHLHSDLSHYSRILNPLLHSRNYSELSVVRTQMLDKRIQIRIILKSQTDSLLFGNIWLAFTESQHQLISIPLLSMGFNNHTVFVMWFISCCSVLFLMCVCVCVFRKHFCLLTLFWGLRRQKLCPERWSFGFLFFLAHSGARIPSSWQNPLFVTSQPDPPPTL